MLSNLQVRSTQKYYNNHLNEHYNNNTVLSKKECLNSTFCRQKKCLCIAEHNAPETSKPNMILILLAYYYDCSILRLSLKTGSCFHTPVLIHFYPSDEVENRLLQTFTHARYGIYLRKRGIWKISKSCMTFR